MSTITNDKIRLIWLLALFASSLSWPVIPAWATGFTPVTQCFRDTGAPGWIMQEYSSGVKNTTVPLTAATGIDAAGSGWLRLTDNTNNQSGNAYYTLPINVTQLGIQAQFSYTAWGGTGADGISLYLFDGATTPANFVQGVFGGGLGYCQQNNYGGSSSSTSPTKTYVYGTPSTNKFELKNWTAAQILAKTDRPTMVGSVIPTVPLPCVVLATVRTATTGWRTPTIQQPQIILQPGTQPQPVPALQSASFTAMSWSISHPQQWVAPPRTPLRHPGKLLKTVSIRSFLLRLILELHSRSRVQQVPMLQPRPI